MAKLTPMTSRAETTPAHEHTPVSAIMKLWPETIRLFLAHRMACVGCPVGGLHTLEEACSEHKVDLVPLLAEINHVARTTRARFPQPG